MRVKLHILAPLPERRVVLPLVAGTTIGAVAEGVALALLRDSGVRGRDLVLEVDGFELLPESTADVIDPRDVVSVRLRPRAGKRKAIDEGGGGDGGDASRAGPSRVAGPSRPGPSSNAVHVSKRLRALGDDAGTPPPPPDQWPHSRDLLLLGEGGVFRISGPGADDLSDFYALQPEPRCRVCNASAWNNTVHPFRPVDSAASDPGAADQYPDVSVKESWTSEDERMDDEPSDDEPSDESSGTDSSGTDSSGTDSSDSDSDSSSETASSSSSSSSGSSQSSSSSSLPSSSPPRAFPTLPLRQTESHVAPGHGKRTTQERNLRRRRKRQKQKSQVAAFLKQHPTMPCEECPEDGNFGCHGPEGLHHFCEPNLDKGHCMHCPDFSKNRKYRIGSPGICSRPVSPAAPLDPRVPGHSADCPVYGWGGTAFKPTPAASPTPEPTPSSPLAPSAPGTTVTTKTVPPEYVPRDMANPNKKRGFRSAMMGVPATHVSFHDDEGGFEGSVDTAEAVPSVDKAEATSKKSKGKGKAKECEAATTPTPPSTRIKKTHFVPPSELASLPSNVFVSASEYPYITDAERRRRDERDAKREAKRAAKAASKAAGQSGAAPANGTKVNGAQRRASPSYDEVNEHDGANGGDGNVAELSAADAEAAALFARVEAAYDTLPLCNASFAPGALVAYKAVELDMTSFSPEFRIVVARVVRATGTTVSVTRVPRPGEDGDDAASDVPVAATREWRNVD